MGTCRSLTGGSFCEGIWPLWHPHLWSPLASNAFHRTEHKPGTAGLRHCVTPQGSWLPMSHTYIPKTPAFLWGQFLGSWPYPTPLQTSNQTNASVSLIGSPWSVAAMGTPQQVPDWNCRYNKMNSADFPSTPGGGLDAYIFQSWESGCLGSIAGSPPSTDGRALILPASHG